MYTSLSPQIARARLIFEAVPTDHELAQRLTQLGYSADALAVGQRLYAACAAAHASTLTLRNDKSHATETAQVLQDRVWCSYSRLINTARAVFAQDSEAFAALGLATAASKARRTRSELLGRARTLYQSLLDDQALLAAIAEVGYPQAQLEAELADAHALEQAIANQQGQIARTKARAVKRAESLAAFKAWMRRFNGIAVPALYDRPDLLARIGLNPRWRSSPTRSEPRGTSLPAK